MAQAKANGNLKSHLHAGRYVRRSQTPCKTGVNYPVQSASLAGTINVASPRRKCGSSPETEHRRGSGDRRAAPHRKHSPRATWKRPGNGPETELARRAPDRQRSAHSSRLFVAGRRCVNCLDCTCNCSGHVIRTSAPHGCVPRRRRRRRRRWRRKRLPVDLSRPGQQWVVNNDHQREWPACLRSAWSAVLPPLSSSLLSSFPHSSAQSSPVGRDALKWLRLHVQRKWIV